MSYPTRHRPFVQRNGADRWTWHCSCGAAHYGHGITDWRSAYVMAFGHATRSI